MMNDHKYISVLKWNLNCSFNAKKRGKKISAHDRVKIGKTCCEEVIVFNKTIKSKFVFIKVREFILKKYVLLYQE